MTMVTEQNSAPDSCFKSLTVKWRDSEGFLSAQHTCFMSAQVRRVGITYKTDTEQAAPRVLELQHFCTAHLPQA